MLRRTGRCDPIQLREFVGRVMLDFQFRAARLRLGRGEAAVARPREPCEEERHLAASLNRPVWRVDQWLH